MAALEWLLGRPDEALALAEAAVTGGRDVGTRADLAAALSILGLANVVLGDLDAASRSADEALAIALELGSTRLEVAVRTARVAIFVELGARDRLTEDVTAGLAASVLLGRPASARPFLAGRAWLEATGGEPAAASGSLGAVAALASQDQMSDALAERAMARALEASAGSEARAQA
jgi:hypothetical protein